MSDIGTSNGREYSVRISILSLLFLSVVCCGCRVLEPIPIHRVRNNLPSDLTPDHEPIMERGQPRRVIDAFGWVWGIPSKLMLWNRKVESHSISPETEQRLEEYMVDNQLVDVKVRLNQYRPLDDWRRLVRNKSVAWPWRYTFGVVATATETVVPGRLFGGDHFNPYTSTIHLYSDLPAVALHEAAHMAAMQPVLSFQLLPHRYSSQAFWLDMPQDAMKLIRFVSSRRHDLCRTIYTKLELSADLKMASLDVS